mmetsp:Transcript_25743/g.67543  ORF Transcript_25743/g.67543 Transcript_25743/m.67543 type:complete len:202 (+) Transcript_25743:188-793(+)
MDSPVQSKMPFVRSCCTIGASSRSIALRPSLFEARIPPFSTVHGAVSESGASLGSVPGSRRTAAIFSSGDSDAIATLTMSARTAFSISGWRHSPSADPSKPSLVASRPICAMFAWARRHGRSILPSATTSTPPLSWLTYTDCAYSFSMFSTAMYSPPRSLTRFFRRSTILTEPSGVKMQISPVRNHPSSRNSDLVFSGSRK